MDLQDFPFYFRALRHLFIQSVSVRPVSFFNYLSFTLIQLLSRLSLQPRCLGKVSTFPWFPWIACFKICLRKDSRVSFQKIFNKINSPFEAYGMTNRWKINCGPGFVKFWDFALLEVNFNTFLLLDIYQFFKGVY